MPDHPPTKEPLRETAACVLSGLAGMLLLLLISQRRRLMTLGGLIWAFWAFSLYYSVRPLHLFVSWPWNSTPVWRLDLHGRWAGFPWEIVGVGTLLILTTGCAAVLGERLGRLLFPDNGRMGRVIWGSGLVFAILGYVAFGLGVVGGLGSAQWVFGLLLVLGVALALFSIGTDFRRKPRPEAMRSGEGSALSRPEWILILALAIVQFLAMLYALTPSVQSDALRYHLAAPQEWLKAGRITYLPYEAFSNFPFLVEMLFLYGLGLGSDLLAKGMHFVFLPLSTGAVALIAHEIAGAYRLRGIRSGVLAALAWGTLPLTIPLAGWAFIDLTVAFFTLAMVYFLIRWARSGHARHWIAAAVFGGLLCASKYTGVVFVMWGALLMGVWGLRMDGFRRIGLWLGRAALFGLIAAALASPWWIKNVIYTGNPVYPLAWSVFDGGEWDEDLDLFYRAKTQEKGIGTGPRPGERKVAFAGDVLRLPWLTAIHPQIFEGFQVGPLFWVFSLWIAVWVVASLFRIRAHPAEAMLALWLLFAIGFWFFTYQSNRFLIPGWGLAMAISAAVIVRAGKSGRQIGLLCLAAFLIPATYGMLDSARWLLFDGGRFGPSGGNRWPAYTLGALSRNEYLASQLNYYPAARYCGKKLGAEDKVLLVGEHRVMHWPCAVAGSDWFDRPRILEWLRGAESADELLDRLETAGFTHLFFNLAEWGWPEDSHAQLGESPASPASAWYYNRRHFSQREIRLIQEILQSDRLRVVFPPVPERIFLTEIQPGNPTFIPRSQPKN